MTGKVTFRCRMYAKCGVWVNTMGQICDECKGDDEE